MEKLNEILEKELCYIWNKALVAEKRNYDPDIEIPKAVDQATQSINQWHIDKVKEERLDAWKQAREQYAFDLKMEKKAFIDKVKELVREKDIADIITQKCREITAEWWEKDAEVYAKAIRSSILNKLEVGDGLNN